MSRIVINAQEVSSVKMQLTSGEKVDDMRIIRMYGRTVERLSAARITSRKTTMSTDSAVPVPVRLAERDALAVDLCSCGTLALHVGALSLRLDLDSVKSLIDVLSDAVAKREVLMAKNTRAPGDALRERGVRWSISGTRERRGKA
jgi:hypothetical protein